MTPPPDHARILVIDDEPLVRTAIARMLSERHEVVTIDDAAEGVALIERGARFDLILCDVEMPRTSGRAFYEAVQRLAGDQAGRIVFISGGSSPAGAEFVAGVANRTLAKPFDEADLRALVAELVVG